MANKNKIICMNCGREMPSKRAALNDGWIISEEDNTVFCCCVCIQEHRDKQRKASKTAKKRKTK